MQTRNAALSLAGCGLFTLALTAACDKGEAEQKPIADLFPGKAPWPPHCARLFNEKEEDLAPAERRVLRSGLSARPAYCPSQPRFMARARHSKRSAWIGSSPEALWAG